jgi:hypothetical protein
MRVDVDMVEKRGEPLLLPLPCGLPYAVQRLGHALPGLSPVIAFFQGRSRACERTRSPARIGPHASGRRCTARAARKNSGDPPVGPGPGEQPCVYWRYC